MTNIEQLFSPWDEVICQEVATVTFFDISSLTLHSPQPHTYNYSFLYVEGVICSSCSDSTFIFYDYFLIPILPT